MDVTQSEFDGIMAVFERRGIEIPHSVQDGQVRVYSHFEVEAILWARGVIDRKNSLNAVITSIYADFT